MLPLEQIIRLRLALVELVVILLRQQLQLMAAIQYLAVLHLLVVALGQMEELHLQIRMEVLEALAVVGEAIQPLLAVLAILLAHLLRAGTLRLRWRIKDLLAVQMLLSVREMQPLVAVEAREV